MENILGDMLETNKETTTAQVENKNDKKYLYMFRYTNIMLLWETTNHLCLSVSVRITQWSLAALSVREFALQAVLSAGRVGVCGPPPRMLGPLTAVRMVWTGAVHGSCSTLHPHTTPCLSHTCSRHSSRRSTTAPREKVWFLTFPHIQRVYIWLKSQMSPTKAAAEWMNRLCIFMSGLINTPAQLQEETRLQLLLI